MPLSAPPREFSRLNGLSFAPPLQHPLRQPLARSRTFFPPMHLLSAAIDATWIILSLVIIESLLSVDNALAIASLASHLPAHQRALALRLGIIGAYAFRGLALLVADWIIDNHWVKLIGAAYLIYLMCSHLGCHPGEEHGLAPLRKQPGLWMTVIQIELMDLTLSIDNVVAAVVMSPRFWVVFTGVAIGILGLRILAGYVLGTLEKFPVLKDAAFILVGYVGVLMLVELGAGHEVSSTIKFTGILVILAICLLYDRSPALQRVFDPTLSFTRRLMRWGASGIDFILIPIIWPLKKLIGVVRRQAGEPEEG